ncbi:MAG: acyl-CoA thioesterase [Planctomycetaceae bacterium]|nr:acyl-CoA thioesterase [Planctomycetaceae bacterium]
MSATLPSPIVSHQLNLRVNYHETDGQRRVHHGNYLNYFERGRVEMLRAMGTSYRELEDTGLMLVVSELTVRYHSAAQFDDTLVLTTNLMEIRKVRLSHHYQIHRADELIVDAESIIACVDKTGRPKRLPQTLLDL